MFDAGTIAARMEIDLTSADKALREFDARVTTFERKRHIIRISAVVDPNDLARARRQFAQFDQTITRDAIQRSRGSGGSLLGFLVGARAGNRLAGGGGGGGDNRGGGGFLRGLAGGLGPGILGIGLRASGIIGAAGIGLSALPALAGIGGVLGIGGIGAGVIGLGAKELIGTKTKPGELFGPFQQAQKAFQSTFAKAAQGLADPLRKVFGEIPHLMQSIQGPLKQLFSGAGTLIGPFVHGLTDLARQVLPLLGQAFRIIAPLIRPLIDGFSQLLRGLLSGLIPLLKAAGPAVRIFAQALGDLGGSIGQMFRYFAPAIKASSTVLLALLKVVNELFPIIGKLAAVFAQALAPVIKDVSSVIRALLPFLLTIGHIVASLAGAILTDLVAAFGALARLLRAVAPGINLLGRALGQIFTVLENTGVFAILGDALEALVPALAKLINSLIRGLVPILPPVINFISKLSSLIIQELVGGILALLPPLTKLATVTLQALAQLLPVIIPLLLGMAKFFTGAIVTAVSDLATALSAVINAIPAPVLRGIAEAILIIIGAVKAWAIAQGILNIALDANPIGLITIAIAALVVGVVELVKHWKQVWGDIKQWAKDAWNFLTHGWGQVLIPGLTLIRKAAEFLSQHWSQIWGAIKQVALDVGQWLWTDFGAKIVNFFDTTLPNAFRSAVSIIGRVWSTVQGVVTAPIRFVIDHVVDGLISAFDWISDKIGGPHIDPVHPFGLREGGRIGVGTGPTADDVVVRVSKGETVVSEADSRKPFMQAAFAMAGVPGYAKGGKVGGGPGFFGGLFDIGRIIAAITTGNTLALNHAIRDLLGTTGVGGAAGDLASLLAAVPTTLIHDAASFLIRNFRKLLGSGGGASGSVASYAPMILRVLAMLGQPAVDLGIVESQMQTESGGNPSVVNRWDSNWLAGHPSVGLMQVIRGTFDAFAGPFRNIGPFLYGVSINPLANIFAGLNYAVHRYGSAWTQVLGHGHGYSKGGPIREPVIGFGLHSGDRYSFAEHGEEWVTPGRPGGSPVIGHLTLMLPEGTTVASALRELTFRLRTAQLQAYAGVLP